MTPQSRPIEDGSGLDGGPRGQPPERLCVATRTVRPIGEMIRFVVGPDGAAIPDIKGKLPGRGVWVTATHGALGEAIKRNAFARAFRREIRLPADLATRTEQLLLRSVLDALAMAGKAGLVATGFAAAATALQHKDVVVVVHAAEASPEGMRKLAALFRGRPGRSPPAIEFLTSAQLDLALNRPNVVHAALLAGPVSDTFLSRSRRLERYRTGGAGDRGNQAGESAAH